MIKIKEILKSLLVLVMPNSLILWEMRNGSNTSVALTFDDGPNPEITPKIMDVLKNNDVRATFFVLGKNVNKNNKLVREMIESGHEIGSHGYSHLNMSDIHKYELIEDIKKADEELAVFGENRNLYRPPFGVMRFIYLPVIWSMKKTIVMWSIDSRDFESNSSKEVVDRVLHKLKGGDVILLHDCHVITVEAVLKIIQGAKSKGLKFKTISEMMGG